MKPHKHAEIIKAWADGAEIEALDAGHWYKCNYPNWSERVQYRIKPEPKPEFNMSEVLNNTLLIERAHYEKIYKELFDSYAHLYAEYKALKLKSAEVLK
jgi:hypothetical protein